MAVDNNGDNHQPAGRPDGGQYAPKAGQGTDDDLATPSEVALLDAAAMLTGRREQARRDADATTGDDAWYTGKGRYLGYEYADAIVDAARHADDIPEGTTLTDMAFDDEALARIPGGHGLRLQPRRRPLHRRPRRRGRGHARRAR